MQTNPQRPITKIGNAQIDSLFKCSEIKLWADEMKHFHGHSDGCGSEKTLNQLVRRN